MGVAVPGRRAADCEQHAVRVARDRGLYVSVPVPLSRWKTVLAWVGLLLTLVVFWGGLAVLVVGLLALVRAVWGVR